MIELWSGGKVNKWNKPIKKNTLIKNSSALSLKSSLGWSPAHKRCGSLKSSKAQFRFPAVASAALDKNNRQTFENKNSPDEVLTVRAEGGLFEESRNKFVILDYRNIFFLEGAFSNPTELEVAWCCLDVTVVCHLWRTERRMSFSPGIAFAAEWKTAFGFPRRQRD